MRTLAKFPLDLDMARTALFSWQTTGTTTSYNVAFKCNTVRSSVETAINVVRGQVAEMMPK